MRHFFASSWNFTNRVFLPFYRVSARFSSSAGSGAGKVSFSVKSSSSKELTVLHPFQGGGSGGSIRDAGGSFGKMEAAREEEFFRRQQKEQLEKMKSTLDKQKATLEAQIKEHEAELKRLQSLMKEGK